MFRQTHKEPPFRSPQLKYGIFECVRFVHTSPTDLSILLRNPRLHHPLFVDPLMAKASLLSYASRIRPLGQICRHYMHVASNSHSVRPIFLREGPCSLTIIHGFYGLQSMTADAGECFSKSCNRGDRKAPHPEGCRRMLQLTKNRLRPPAASAPMRPVGRMQPCILRIRPPYA